MGWHKATKKQTEDFKEARKQSCYAAGCNQPVIGGRTTDDGLQISYCEFHFVEDFLAQLEEEEKAEALRELIDLLSAMKNQSEFPKADVWN